MTDGAEKVFVIPAERASSESRRFHTDTDCHRLQLSKSYQEKPRDVLADNVEECAFCSGSHSPPQISNTQETRDRLLAMDPDDIGPTGGDA